MLCIDDYIHDYTKHNIIYIITNFPPWNNALMFLKNMYGASSIQINYSIFNSMTVGEYYELFYYCIAKYYVVLVY